MPSNVCVRVPVAAVLRPMQVPIYVVDITVEACRETLRIRGSLTMGPISRRDINVDVARAVRVTR